MAIVFSPLSAKPRAKPAAIRVLPTPPLPETAIFMVLPSGKYFRFMVYLRFLETGRICHIHCAFSKRGLDEKWFWTGIGVLCLYYSCDYCRLFSGARMLNGA
jgi:hypothetical protein